MGRKVTIDRRLLLTGDRTRVVPASDPAGKWVWATPGQQVQRAEAERLGALAPAEPTGDAEEPNEEPSDGENQETRSDTAASEKPAKRRKPAANKKRAAASDKSNGDESGDDSDDGARW